MSAGELLKQAPLKKLGGADCGLLHIHHRNHRAGSE